MKGVIAAVVIAAMIVAGSLFYTNQMMKISDELLEMNASVTRELQAENYSGAAEGVHRLDEYIDDKRTLLSATGNHEQLDKIEMNIRELSGYAEGGQKTDAVSLCGVLSVMFEQLPRDYRITLENIL